MHIASRLKINMRTHKHDEHEQTHITHNDVRTTYTWELLDGNPHPIFLYECKSSGLANVQNARLHTKQATQLEPTEFFPDPMIFMGWMGRGASVQSCKALPTQKEPIRNERTSPIPARESHETRDALMINEEVSDKSQLEWMNPEKARKFKLRERMCPDAMKPEKKMDLPNTKAHAARVRKGRCFTCTKKPEVRSTQYQSLPTSLQ